MPAPESPTPTIRRARRDDLPHLVRLWALPDGNRRDQGAREPLEQSYVDAFEAVERSPENALVVAEVAGRVAGGFQLTIIPYVAYRGGRVAMIESVIVAPEHRGGGVGAAMMAWAIDEARRQGCFRVQLTSNKSRTRAHAFYARLGFERTHEGFKLML